VAGWLDVTDVEIVNPLPVDQVEPWFKSMIITYLGDPAEFAPAKALRAATWEPERAWGARADGRWVATLRTVPHRLSVPGTAHDLAADALTNVTVAATHRRRGLLTAMIGESLAAAKQRGDAVSILIAAEWPIYGRYGYAPASDVAHYTVHTRLPGSRLLPGATGRVRQVEMAELAEIAPAVFEVARPHRAGNINRPAHWWQRHYATDPALRGGKQEPIHIVHEGTRGIDGYLSWTPTGEWDLTGSLGEVNVHELVAVNEQAYRGLWQYLFSIDVVDRIHLRDRPVDEPLQWLLADGRAVRQQHRIDRVWLRLLDVPTALATRRYAVSDQLVIEVDDGDGDAYAAGRFSLDGSPEGAECRPSSREPDLRLTQRTLAATFLGGFTLAQQLPGAAVEELTDGALRRADAMFATPLAPWCATGF
jgi:predicted acetyltransferase